jgi:hypothetical protein
MQEIDARRLCEVGRLWSCTRVRRIGDNSDMDEMSSEASPGSCLVELFELPILFNLRY